MLGAKIRIFLAVIIGVAIVGGAFVMSQKQGEQTPAEAEALKPTDRRHISVTDSNQDGVPDWQANLINSEPIYLDATSSEPYELPDTVTAKFSLRFFEDLMTLDSLGLLKDTKEELVNAALTELDTMTKEKEYLPADLRNITDITDKAALRTYGNLVAGTIFYYQTNDDNEYEIFQRMTRDEDRKHLKELAVIEKQYEDIITALLKLEVPEKYIYQHLAVVNSLSALKTTAAAMQQYFDDPFYTVARYRRIMEDVVKMNESINNLYNALYLGEDIQFAENEALPVLVELLK